MHFILALPEMWFPLLTFARLWCECLRVGPLGITSGFGNSKKTTITSEYANSFNNSESTVNSTSDSGNTSFTLGSTGSGDLAGAVPVIGAFIALLAGLWLITKGRS